MLNRPTFGGHIIVPSFYVLNLPVHDLVNDFLLFAGCPAQIDACGLDTFVAHQVGE